MSSQLAQLTELKNLSRSLAAWVHGRPLIVLLSPSAHGSKIAERTANNNGELTLDTSEAVQQVGVSVRKRGLGGLWEVINDPQLPGLIARMPAEDAIAPCQAS